MAPKAGGSLMAGEVSVVHWRDNSGAVACGRWAYDSTRELYRVTCRRCREIAEDAGLSGEQRRGQPTGVSRHSRPVRPMYGTPAYASLTTARSTVSGPGADGPMHE
jgi:hypothetical protein